MAEKASLTEEGEVEAMVLLYHCLESINQAIPNPLVNLRSLASQHTQNLARMTSGEFEKLFEGLDSVKVEQVMLLKQFAINDDNLFDFNLLESVLADYLQRE